MDISKLKTFKQKYERYLPATFFVAGFLFDIVTLSRIDDWLSLLQQAAYLLIIIQILKLKLLEGSQKWHPHPRLEKVWSYSDEILHFVLGSLLSSYTLLYFVSASLATSLVFLSLIAILLIANELPQVQKSGLTLKFTLFSICLYSYMFIVVSLSIGSVGVIPFLLAVGLGLALPYVFYRQLNQSNQISHLNLKKVMLAPTAAVAAGLTLLYFLKVLPPIPLSVQYMGIYHNFEKVKDSDHQTRFLLSYTRSRFKFWQNGDQDFYAAPGDKIVCFVRVFAPNNFKDRVAFHWLKKNPKGWQSMDKIFNEIQGGRNEGFRGVAIKSNFDPGEWRVQLETPDGREIGRISFEVIAEADSSNRTYHQDLF